ncbi:MAG: acetylornithine deacetylase [Pirellulaceae bacterium]
MKQQVLDLLAELIACDTQNPPRAINTDHKIFDSIRAMMGDQFGYTLTDHGRGRISLLAKRGNPRVLFNVHLDTVPAGDGWNRPPLEMTVDGDRAYGRGVCDIKGAAACLIAAVSAVDADVAILFTTDEEGSESCCVSEFCRSEHSREFEAVIVAEPTECQAVVGHRGYLSVSGQFAGQAGHSSQFDLLPRSANHLAAKWIVDAIERVTRLEEDELDSQSACFNVGRIDGGIKNNVIASSCRVTWSARMPGGCDNSTILEHLTGNPSDYVHWEATYAGAPLPTSQEKRVAAESFCRHFELPVATDVDFFTEASIFSAAGYVSIVLGPGHIAQAHIPDEWVSIEQLERCTALYAEIMQRTVSTLQ